MLIAQSRHLLQNIFSPMVIDVMKPILLQMCPEKQLANSYTTDMSVVIAQTQNVNDIHAHTYQVFNDCSP